MAKHIRGLAVPSRRDLQAGWVRVYGRKYVCVTSGLDVRSCLEAR